MVNTFVLSFEVQGSNRQTSVCPGSGNSDCTAWQRARVITGAFTPSSKPLAHNFRTYHHYAQFHRSTFSQQAALAHLRPKDSLQRQRGPAGPADPERARPRTQQEQPKESPEGKADRPPASAPGAHLHELVLVKEQRVWSLGQVHPTFLHPALRHLSVPTPGDGKKEDPVRTGQTAAAPATATATFHSHSHFPQPQPVSSA